MDWFLYDKDLRHERVTSKMQWKIYIFLATLQYFKKWYKAPRMKNLLKLLHTGTLQDNSYKKTAEFT